VLPALILDIGRHTAPKNVQSSDGDRRAYGAGIVAVVLGAALVFFAFPKKEQEQQLLAEYDAEDAGPPEDRPSPGPDVTGGAEPERPAFVPHRR
jgi:hypothetical protein